MFLKQLDTVGFKSFAERVTVDFGPGVTSVVGPNGSGKSNITDAIRWVLGEQSAKSLRGAKMEDIIFAGSDSRKALNMAEVTLTLDNGDQSLPLEYEEVSVTRRVYRTGESEFFMNNQACRLKDIIDLFMDSGLGREAFSIISQGKVEEILSSKAEERRSIFEEAAGVLKYKQRKKKAEYKLAETQENLNRVEDIIHEIDGQLEPLKEQAAIAKDYLDKKEELKQVEISLLITQIEKLYTQWQDLLKELKSIKEKEYELSSEISEEESAVEKQREQMVAIDQSVDQLQEELLVLTRELEGLEGKKELMKERHKHFEENKEKIEQEQVELADKVEKMKKVVSAEKDKLEKTKYSRRQTKNNLKQTEHALNQDIQVIENQIEDLKSEYIDKLNEQAAKRNEKQLIEKQLSQLNYKKGHQQDKFKDLREERQLLEKKIQDLKETLEQVTRKREQKDQKYKELIMTLNENKQSYEEWQEKLYKGYQYLEKLRSKKEMLEEMKEDFSGYYQGVREVLKARENGKLTGIEGAVLELIDIPGHLMTAIETTLGAQAQHIVVKDEKYGRQAIHWLKQNNKGRATFLPLTAIQSRSIYGQGAADLHNQPGFVGIAVDLVDFSPAYQKAIQHLLGHIVIADQLDQANDIARFLNRKYRIVTLEGDVVNPGGSMSGGAQKKTNQSLFTREKELQELSNKIREFEGKAQGVERKVSSLKEEISVQQSEVQALEAEAAKQKNDQYEQQSMLRELQVRTNHLNEQLQLFDQDQVQYNQDQSEADQRLSFLNKDLEHLFESLQVIQEKIDNLTVTKEKQKVDEANLQERRQELQILLAEQDSAVNNQQEKADRNQEELSSLEEQLKESKSAFKQLLEVVDSNQTEEEMGEEIADKKERKQKTSDRIQELKNERHQYQHEIQTTEKQLKERKRHQQNFTQDIQQKEVKANRLDVELENMLSYLEQEYVLTFERAKRDYPPVEDIEKSSTAVKLIKKAIEELGTVNLGAIEEYDRIQERYVFLKGQQDDLLEAKQTLHHVISEMDSEMERRFTETFTKIREEFVEVFRELFGGGRADLQLSNPDDLLETGVDIVAQPPGKKLQNMSLLSGGERALTAIALLFSILRVRPVPFCVLDEVEAALDEANVDRFAHFLKEFSENTQFIVITHRKGTMEQSDVLYGVTMQESGVSRLVSVRLEDTPELLEV